MSDDSSASGFPNENPRDLEDVSVSGDARRGRAARVLLPMFLAVAFFQASDVIRGMGRAAAAPTRPDPSRFGRRGFGGSRLAYGTPQAGRRLLPGDVKTFSDVPLYDLKTLRTVFIDFRQTNWEAELESNYRRDVDVPANVTIDGTVYKDVGVRFRGNSSYRMVPTGFKRSLNLAFDSTHPDQQVGGYNTLNLLNANSDPTFVRTVLYSEIARNYIPVPKVNFVHVVINGESWGIYLNAQQFNKDFLRAVYGTTKGVRWKVPGSPRGRGGLEYIGDGPEPYKALYELKSKDSEKAWTDLVRLCRLLNTTAPEHLEAVLAPHLDIEGALKFLALEVAFVNTDGYWTRASDYSLFENEQGRFHVLPYDFNEAMGVDGPGGRRGFGGHAAGPTLDPLVGLDDVSKPLRSKLLAVPTLRARYLALVREIADRWLDWNRIAPLVVEYQALIEAEVRLDGRKLYGYDRFDPARLQAFFEQRRAFLLQ
jgi:hypothetical protein